MDLRFVLSEEHPPATIGEVVRALVDEGLSARHQAKNWGDWIEFEGSETVLAIESERGLTASATLEEGDEEDCRSAIFSAFRKLGWQGEDEEGLFPL